MLFLIDAMLIIKYIFIFHLKNPTAVQDDFWTFWINLWTFAFFLLSTTVVNTLPGRDPPRVTICIGKIPLKHINAPYKFPAHIIFALVLTFLIQIGFHSLHLIHENAGNKKLPEYKKYKSKFSGTNNNTIFSYVTIFVAFVLAFIAHSFADVVTFLHPADLDTYPYYIMEYVLENLIPSGTILIFLISHLYKHKQVRRTVWNEMQRLIHF